MKSKVIISFLGLLLLTSVCFAEITPELAEFDKNFCALAAKEDKTPEEWAKYDQKPPYSENKEIIGDYNKDLAVKCANGTFVGKMLNDVSTWQGVPYAEQPVGKLRWRAAVAPKKSNKIFEAYNYGHVAIQSKIDYEMGEDCLSLNIWSNSKNTNKNKPVLVWIHGGGFTVGAGMIYKGYDFVNNNPDIIVVTINYRLGLMASVNFKDLEGGKNAPLQCGFTDQIQALKWIKENIAGFGGDPNNITICGESAGSASCSFLTISPKAKGLFNKAICLSAGINVCNTPEEALPIKDLLLKEFNAKTFYDLQNIPINDLIKFWNEKGSAISPMFPIDKDYFPVDPLKAYADGVSKDITMIQGYTKDEMRIFYLWWGLKTEENYVNYATVIMNNQMGDNNEKANNLFKEYIQELKKSNISKKDIPVEFLHDSYFRNGINHQIMGHINNGGQVYKYNFQKEFTNPAYIKAAHTVDYYYLFELFDGKFVLGTKEDIELAKDFQKMVANFCINSNPSTDKYDWKPFTKENYETMLINNKCELVNNYERDRCEKMLGIFYENPTMQKAGYLTPYFNEMQPQLIINDIYTK